LSNYVNWKKAFKQAAAVGLILCLGLIILIGGFIVVNYDNLGRLVRVVYLVNSQHLEDPPLSKLVDGAIEGIVSSLDTYSSFQDAEENKALLESLQGSLGGIGVYLSVADPQKLVIRSPIKGSPADRAGLEAGDIILKIDGIDVSTMTQQKAVSILRGEPGTKVTVGIYRPRTGKDFSVNLIREKISVPTVQVQALPGREDIALIDISNFSQNTGEELEREFSKMDWDSYKGFIIDLRYNCGGEVNASIKVASLLVPQGDIVHVVDKKGRIETKKSTAQYINKPFVILINEYTASAAEIVSGAVKDYGSGDLVGVKTFGKGVVQTLFPLDNNTSVKLTTDKYLTPLKNDIHQKGIEPDVEVHLKEGEKPTILPEDTNFDSQLTKAIEVLTEKIKGR
jgi:carboxyl-terminal processing protease